MMFLQVDVTRTSLEVQGVQRGVAMRAAPSKISITIDMEAMNCVPSSWSRLGAAMQCTVASSQPPKGTNYVKS